MELTVDTFFNRYMFAPCDAAPGKDRAIAVIATIACVIFTLGILHAAIAIHQWRMSRLNELGPTDGKAKRIGQSYLSKSDIIKDNNHARYLATAGFGRWRNVPKATPEQVAALRNAKKLAEIYKIIPCNQINNPPFRLSKEDSKGVRICLNPIGSKVSHNGQPRWIFDWDDDINEENRKLAEINALVDEYNNKGEKIELRDNLIWPEGALHFYLQLAEISEQSKSASAEPQKDNTPPQQSVENPIEPYSPFAAFRKLAEEQEAKKQSSPAQSA